MKPKADSNTSSKSNFDASYHEHCRFKNAPCKNTGQGWYDRCAWCKDNNGFKSKNNFIL